MAISTLLLATLTACSGSDSSQSGLDPSNLTASGYYLSPPASVTVAPKTASVVVGDTVRLSTTIKNASGQILAGLTGIDAQWSSSDTTIATVAQTGLVKGLRAGVVTVTATAGTISSTSTVTVDTVATAKPPTPTPPIEKDSTPAGSKNPPVDTSTKPVLGSGSGLSGKGFVYDDFSGYANTAALLNRITPNIGGTATGVALYSDGANANLAAIDNTVLYNGHPTMKYNQPGGMANSPELWVGLGKTYSHIWFRAKIRFSAGFTTTGTLTNSANAYKLLGWGWNNYYGSGRLEISNTTQYQLYWTALAMSNSATVGGGTTGIASNITTEWSDGGWYDYIIEVDYSQGPTGVARVWMAKDGQTPVLRTTSSGTMQGGAPLPTLNQIMLGMNFNQTRAAGQTQALWYGQWEVVDGSQYSNPFGVN
ncbi:MAG TPA: Ig-like domain-containing protein [Gemmatimonadaceae bacterium]|nr:Ig-like domain-containing protein [Gemmatimonadaceae bacterium]